MNKIICKYLNTFTKYLKLHLVNIKLLYLFLLFSYTMQSQCFDCEKNVGDHTDESAMDIEKTIDGIVYLVDSGGFVSSRIIKYDFNCNEIWSKNFGYDNVAVKAITSDNLGNIYIIILNSDSTNGGLGPFNISGFMMSPGLNFYKLNSSGTILWHKHIGPGVGYEMANIFYYQNELYVTGTFHEKLTFNNNVNFSFPFTNYTRAFVAKYNTNGDFINAISHGDGNDIFKCSEIDNQGNIYLTRSHYNGYYSNIDKFNSSLQLDWSKVLSSSSDSKTFGIYRPTGLRFNSENNKLYIWGKISLTTNIMGNTFFVNSSNAVFQSVLTELNSINGNLENIKRFDNSSSYTNFYSSAVLFDRSAYMAEKNGYLYILTSFRGTMVFPNGIATSTATNSNSFPAEDLVLFKMKLSDFSSELLFQSKSVPNINRAASNLPGDIVFNGDDLYLTSTFSSKPMQINNVTINNNSGNNDPDAMLYKFNINSTSNNNNADIIVSNTCFNGLTNFKISGTFDSILWDFDDPNSTINNSATIYNPQHQFTAKGTYNVSAKIQCGSELQTINKEISITEIPANTSLNHIYACETILGSGISNSFDTSGINATISGNQNNLVIEFKNSNGNFLPSPLPNPYTNTTTNEETIIVKSYFKNNPLCYVETNLKLYTISKPFTPAVNSTQSFCFQQNATLNDITITGQNIKWYDQLTTGSLLLNTTPLQNGNTYYASQTINGCESERIPVTVTIQNTLAPTGNVKQSFCTSQNPTLHTIAVVGSTIKWYDNSTLGNFLADTTPLVNGKTYYATQTVNNCESVGRLAVTVSLISSLPANNYDFSICDDLNDGKEYVKLEDYNSHLISIATNYNFSYYETLTDAENEVTINKITTASNYKLLLGENKIYVRINSNTPCYAIALFKITLLPKPIIPIQDIVPICENKSNLIEAGSGADIYLWSNGKTTQTIIVDNPGELSVKVTKNHGTLSCISEKSFTVKTSNIAKITAIETKDWTDNDNTITVFVTGSGDFEYSIDGHNYKDSNTFSGVNSGEYIVQVRDKNGCGTATQEVYLLMYPKFFTPNGDSFNDTWKIKSSDTENELTIKIFDRFGKLLKELDSNSNGWDGTYIGQTLPATDYWFVVTRKNGKEYKGHFSLKR
jgi:gliding motility-associated-like protein